MRTVSHAQQHVGEVVLAADHFVAHAGPARFFGRDDLYAVLLVNAEDGGHDDAGAVGQRDKTDLHLFLFRCVRALRVNGSTQGGADTDSTDCSRLKDATAAKFSVQKMGHQDAPKLERQTKKGILAALGLCDAETHTGRDAFVRFGLITLAVERDRSSINRCKQRARSINHCMRQFGA